MKSKGMSSMKNKIVLITLSFVFLASTGVANALVRENIPATYTENRDLTFRYKNMNTKKNPLKVVFETSLTDANGDTFSVTYSAANGNIRFGRANRKATFTTPIVESDTRGIIRISGGVVPENDPLEYAILILNDLTLVLDPQSSDPNMIVSDVFGNSPIGSIPGPQGPEGPAGPAGATGSQGPAGPAGAGMVIGSSLDVNSLTSINVSGSNYLTLTDSNTASTEVIETITGGTRGQTIYLELDDYIRFRVNNSGAANTIHWGRGTTTGDIQPTSSASNYRFLVLVHNGTHWFLVGRTNG